MQRRAPTRKVSSIHLILLAVVAIIFIWSGIGPADRYTWLLEVAPVIVAVPMLIFLYRRFRFTTLAYTLIALHAIVLMVGGHYTYAEVPLFNWLRDTLHLGRNHYDRLGHFAQGFVPAILAREVLIRCSPIRRQNRFWLPFLVICVCMTISSVYELAEWLVAVTSGSSADAFLGGQGDVWDTQKDMAWCLIGTLMALLLLSRSHERQLERTASSSNANA